MDTTPRQQHILIVDDYADAVDIWAMYLRSKGYRVTTAIDGGTALSAARIGAPDLIVLDLEMPGISGFEVARQLRSDASTEHIPLIAATGFSQRRQIDLAKQAGFDTVVVKPCDPDELIGEIERLLAEADPARLERPVAQWIT